MVKKLRSLIHEQFPLELRVKLELLSRRRDISNKEKQEELFKLLREFDVKGCVPLGPGTNRYAFKLNGFVVKMATDHDGKIDNMKEMKMAKILFPYVTKTYEISSNGTLLVAEYIQPFTSYGEMLGYADKIRAILHKLSAVFLIGDVGITNKNYANWGLRIGSDEPVCLDFAYVYDVKSELFICRNCKSGSMLVPNEDFTALICPNPACGKTYLFEDIRRRIGNDLHNHEIGDLTQEGYELSASGVMQELDSQRSNYLVKKARHKTEEKRKENEEVVIPDTFIADKEENKMANNEIIKNMASAYAKMIKVRPLPVNLNHKNGLAFEGDIGDVIDTFIIPEPEDEPIEVVAEIADDDTVDDMAIPDPVEETKMPEIVDIVPEEPKEEVVPDDFVFEAIPAPATPPMNPILEEEEPPIVDPVYMEKPATVGYNWNDDFIAHMPDLISKLGSNLGHAAYTDELFDEVRPSVKSKKFLTENFQKSIGTVFFTTIAELCQMTPIDENNKRRYVADPNKMQDNGYPTARWLERIYTEGIMKMEAHHMITKYRWTFKDFLGLQPEFREIFTKRYQRKFREIDIAGAQITADYIMNIWGVPTEEAAEPDPVIPPAVEEEKVIETPTEPPKPSTEPVFETVMDSMDSSDDEDDGNNPPSPLEVVICPDDTFDIIRVNTDDAFGSVSIPIYVDKSEPTTIHPTDNKWSWLRHMVPDLMFRTKDPQYWLALNDEQPMDEESMRFVILQGTEEESIIGIYNFGGLYIIDDAGDKTPVTDETICLRVNSILENTFSGACMMSHLRRSLSATDLIYDEDYIKGVLEIEDDDATETTHDDKQSVALSALLTPAPVVKDEPKVEEPPKSVAAPKPVEKKAPANHPEEIMTFKPIRRNG